MYPLSLKFHILEKICLLRVDSVSMLDHKTILASICKSILLYIQTLNILDFNGSLVCLPL
jgi:hypothetical protein